MLVDPIVSDLGLARGDTVLAFVNGMGGTPLIELYVAFNSVKKILGGKGISIGRSLVGNYITSLEMAGFSVTLLRLDDELTGCGMLRSTPRPCAGASDRLGDRQSRWTLDPAGTAPKASDDDDQRRTRGLAAPGGRPTPRVGRRAHRARPGDRRRGPRDEHGPRLHGHRRQARCCARSRRDPRRRGRHARPGRPAQAGRQDPHQYGRWSGGSSLRDRVPPGRRRRRRGPSCRRPMVWLRSKRRRAGSPASARRPSARRPCWTH